MPSAQDKQQRKPRLSKLELARQALDKYASFETKKSIHVNLTKTTHTEFRKLLLEHDLSMQEVFEWFAHLASSKDERAIVIMREAKTNKRSRILNNLAGMELENVYDALSEISPLSE